MYNTEKEIRDELNSISKCLQLVCGKEDEILRTFSGARRMWFIGSGSSFCLAKSAAAMFTMRCDIPSLAVAAGDLLLHTERYLNAVKGSVVVFVSRSGMTSEVLRSMIWWQSWRAYPPFRCVPMRRPPSTTPATCPCVCLGHLTRACARPAPLAHSLPHWR